MLRATCICPGRLEAGCDEAGRGCLAGPVFAAAVILPDGWTHPWLDDSKRMTPRRRELLAPIIKAEAVAWTVAEASEKEIDEINILNASILAMHRALDALTVKPGAVAVDGNRFKPWGQVECTTVVKGDSLYGNIAAASVLAKTARDACMLRLHKVWPQYAWHINKGYPTKAHRQAIALHGPSPAHRLTFRLLP